MATKTFKIGEYAKGGVITAEVGKTSITIIAKNWDFSTGSRRSSDQTNAKETHRINVGIQDAEAQRKLTMWLCEETTSYYADEIMKWVLSKTKLSKNLFW